jgi:hypothetical protein
MLLQLLDLTPRRLKPGHSFISLELFPFTPNREKWSRAGSKNRLSVVNIT